MSTKARLERLAALAILAAIALVARIAVHALDARGQDSGRPADFSVARAMEHVVAIASKPHGVGSAAHAEARDAVVRAMEALGAHPEVQRAPVLETRYAAPARGFPVRVTWIENVIGRLEGNAHATGDTSAVLLMAHYDSVPMAPGASDDAAGVAAVLEAARALRAGAPLRHDVLLVVTDGEELGLLGARAFVAQHPAAKDARIVLNFESRGDRGTVFMFQTSDGNAALVHEMAEALPGVAANSLAREVYRRMPNDTDLTEWLRVPWAQGLNFANVDGFDRYHAPTDDPAHLDRGILRQHGDRAVALTRRLADLSSLELPRDADATYFDLGSSLVRYPVRAALPIAILVALLAAALAAVVVRKGHGRARGILVGAAVALAPAAIVFLLARLLWGLVARAHLSARLLAIGSDGPAQLHAISFAALGAFLTLLVYAAVLRRIRIADLAAGSALAWSAVAIGLAATIPGVAYLVTWPLAITVVAALAAALTPRGLEDVRPLAILLQTIAACVVTVLLAPDAAQTMAAFGADAAPGVATITALGMAFALPVVYVVLLIGRGVAPILFFLVAILGNVAAVIAPSFDEDHPRPDTLVVAIDQDANHTYVATPDDAPDAWTGRALGGGVRAALPGFLVRDDDRSFVRRELPMIDQPPAKVEVVRDDRAAGKRTIVVHVSPPPDAEDLVLTLPKEAGITRARAAGFDLPLLGDGSFSVAASAPPVDGFDLELDLPENGHAALRVLARLRALPESVQETLGARPPDLMARPGTVPPYDELLVSDRTIVLRTFDL